VAAARAGDELDEQKAVLVRVLEYTVPDRTGDGMGELITLVTTITDAVAAAASVLSATYHDRWEHEAGNDQLKAHLRGPGVLRSKSPDMVIQEIYGYLLTHHAISALTCRRNICRSRFWATYFGPGRLSTRNAELRLPGFCRESAQTS
jgi:hypothetical protein